MGQNLWPMTHNQISAESRRIATAIMNGAFSTINEKVGYENK